MRMEIDEHASKNAQLASGYLNISSVQLEKYHYFFYDLETSGLHTQFDQIFQFSAILISHEDFESLDFKKLVNFINRDTFSKPSDSNVFLKQVAIPNETEGGSATLNYINCYVKLNDDVIPSPQALLINRVNTHPIQENDLLNEFELSWLLHDFFRQNWSKLTLVGHNLLKYDHCMLRALFYRNLHNPDILEKMSVFDTYPIAVIYSLIAKHAFNKWPTKTVIKESSEPEQQPVFKLEKFKKRLGVTLKSHHGFNDTLVTLALAVKLYSCKIERIWNSIPMICSFERTSEKLRRIVASRTTERLMKSADLAKKHSSTIGDAVEKETKSYQEKLAKGIRRKLSNNWLGFIVKRNQIVPVVFLFKLNSKKDKYIWLRLDKPFNWQAGILSTEYDKQYLMYTGKYRKEVLIMPGTPLCHDIFQKLLNESAPIYGKLTRRECLTANLSFLKKEEKEHSVPRYAELFYHYYSTYSEPESNYDNHVLTQFFTTDAVKEQADKVADVFRSDMAELPPLSLSDFRGYMAEFFLLVVQNQYKQGGSSYPILGEEHDENRAKEILNLLYFRLNENILATKKEKGEASTYQNKQAYLVWHCPVKNGIQDFQKKSKRTLKEALMEIAFLLAAILRIVDKPYLHSKYNFKPKHQAQIKLFEAKLREQMPSFFINYRELSEYIQTLNELKGFFLVKYKKLFGFSDNEQVSKQDSTIKIIEKLKSIMKVIDDALAHLKRISELKDSSKKDNQSIAEEHFSFETLFDTKHKISYGTLFSQITQKEDGKRKRDEKENNSDESISKSASTSAPPAKKSKIDVGATALNTAVTSTLTSVPTDAESRQHSLANRNESDRPAGTQVMQSSENVVAVNNRDEQETKQTSSTFS